MKSTVCLIFSTGATSRAIVQAGGPSIVEECNRLGKKKASGKKGWLSSVIGRVKGQLVTIHISRKLRDTMPLLVFSLYVRLDEI